MRIGAINFTGKYQLNANYPIEDAKKRYSRNTLLAYWSDFSTNRAELSEKLNDALKYGVDPKKEITVEFDLDKRYDSRFEECMNVVGQPFKRIG